LIEKYVQLILYGMRRHTLLVDRGKYLWGRYLPLVVDSINDRVLKLHGYSPSQLLFGITPRRSGWDITPAQEHIADSLTRLYENDPYFNSLAIEEANTSIRLASLDEARNRCLDRLECSHLYIISRESRKARWTAPKVGDLVLMRNIALDGQHGHKLQARSEGPYMLDDPELYKVSLDSGGSVAKYVSSIQNLLDVHVGSVRVERGGGERYNEGGAEQGKNLCGENHGGLDRVESGGRERYEEGGAGQNKHGDGKKIGSGGASVDGRLRAVGRMAASGLTDPGRRDGTGAAGASGLAELDAEAGGDTEWADDWWTPGV
jgi:hypothetical protein